MRATQQDVARVAQYAAMAAHAESAWHIQNALEAAWALEGDAYDADAVECAIAALIRDTAPTREPFAHGAYGVSVTRVDGTVWTDLAHVSRAYAAQHADYLRRNLPGNLDCKSVDIIETGF